MLLRKSRFRVKRIFLPPLLTVLILIGLRAACFACSYEANRQKTCDRLQADAIFVGTVIDTVRTDYVFNGHTSPGYSIRFSVQKSLRGNLGSEVTVATGSGRGRCGTPPLGDRYLIFATKETDGKLWTGLCGNRPLKSDADVAAAIEPIQAAITPGRGSLSGWVTYDTPVSWDKDGKPVGGGTHVVPDLLIRATSITNDFTTSTAKDGTYEFKDLPNGIYTVTPELQPNWTYDQRGFDLQFVKSVSDGSCAKVNFQLQQSTRLRGRVTVAPGKQFGVPLDGTVGLQWIEAIPVGLQKTNDRSGVRGIAYPDGRFELWPIPPGDYYVGINISSSPTPQAPYTPTYYPGVTDKKAARVVHLDAGESKYIEFPPPELAAKRTVKLVAIGLDGKPLSKVRVQREDLQHPGNAINSTVDVNLDANGSGTMDVYAGVDYHLHASYVWLYREEWCAAPVTVSAGSKPTEVRFVMDRNNKVDEQQAAGRYHSNCDIVVVDSASNNLAKPTP